MFRLAMEEKKRKRGFLREEGLAKEGQLRTPSQLGHRLVLPTSSCAPRTIDS
jgi:hypothetical protein